MKLKQNSALLLFAGVVAVLILDSCAKGLSSDVNQNKIYAIYEVFYNENTDKTTVSARFQFGGATGTNLQLDSTSYVTFNNDTLPYNGWVLCHYKEYSGKITSGTFKYANLDGDIFTNSISGYDTLGFQSGFDTIVKSQANTITWVGSPLAANETVSVFIGSWTWGQDALAAVSGAGNTNIVLGINQLNSVAVGTATVYMDRTYQVDVAEGTSVGGVIRGVYRPQNKVVQVIN